jgi:glycosyltransferase involved in cell wall biosynthesis
MSLKIAILGTRGIPNNYGGFEQVAGYLSKGLVEKGHDVTVYNSHRHPWKEKTWNGVNTTRCYDPEFIGTAGQFIYDLNCILDCRKKNFDIILMLGYTSSSVWKNFYPADSTVITNMDGIEWRRSKYSRPVRSFIRYAEKLAIATKGYFVADSPVIKEYLDNKYGINCCYIPYGAEVISGTNTHIPDDLGLSKQIYYLLVARMEPENNIEMILDGFAKTTTDKFFIAIGNTHNRFGNYLARKYKNDQRIKFIGPLYDNIGLRALISNCSIYFHGHSVGGTNPSLLEAMSAKAFIAAHDNTFNRSVLGEDGLYFNNADDVTNIMLKENISSNVMIENNYNKILNEYNWGKIVEQYEQFFYECLAVKNKKLKKGIEQFA